MSLRDLVRDLLESPINNTDLSVFARDTRDNGVTPVETSVSCIPEPIPSIGIAGYDTEPTESIAEIPQLDPVLPWIKKVQTAQSGDALLDLLLEFREQSWAAEETALLLVEVLLRHVWLVEADGSALNQNDARALTGLVSRMSEDVQAHWWQLVRCKCTQAVVELLEQNDTRPDVAVAAGMFAGPGARLFTEHGVSRMDGAVGKHAPIINRINHLLQHNVQSSKQSAPVTLLKLPARGVTYAGHIVD